MITNLIPAEHYLAALVESSHDAIIGKTLDGTILSWNRGAENIYGYTAAEIVGRSVALLIPPDRESDLSMILESVRRGERIETYETVRRRKDGQTIPVSLTVSPIRDTAGMIIGASTIAQDISTMKPIEAALRASESNLRSFYESVPFMMGIVEVIGDDIRLISENTARVQFFGRTSAAPPTMPAGDLVVPRAIRDEWIAHYREAQESQAPVHFEYPHGAGPAQQWLAATVAPITTAGADPLAPARFCYLGEDITAKKQDMDQIRQLNQDLQRRGGELEAANKELEAFSYSVSHDLRAPLRAIDGFSRILLRESGADLSPKTGRYLQLIRTNAQQMGQLIDDLLIFSRLSRQALNRQTVGLESVVRDALVTLQADQEGRALDLHIGELGSAQADPALLKQVWINLLANALKFTRRCARAEIEVGCRQQDNETIYFVRDNGVGFDMRYVDKLFGVFQRLHRAEDYEGTGVGLAIVHRVITRHGGRVWAEAQPDKGATFYFTLTPSATSADSVANDGRDHDSGKQ